MSHIFAALFQHPAGSVFCEFFKAGQRRTVTFGELCASAGLAAAGLRDAGVIAGQVVPIVLEHRVELYSSFVGCTLIGAVPSFLPPLTAKQDPTLFRQGMSALLARIDPPCVIGSDATLPSLAGQSVLNVDAPEQARTAIGFADAPAAEIAFLQHSSGTTGLKKGVQLTHDAVLAQVARYTAAIALDEHDIIASWLPLYHDMGLITGFLLPAILGVPVVSLDALEWTARPTLLLDMMERFRATLAWLPNFAFHHIARMAPAGREWDLRSVRLLVNCSEPCRTAAFDVFAARLAKSSIGPERLAACYAMAECVFAATQTAPGQAPRRHGEYVSSGRAIAGIEIDIRDIDRATGIGAIHLRGPFLFDGYFGQPELIAAKLHDGWLTTGDLGFLAEGELVVVGRADDMLNINGRKILAHEVEDALAMLPGLLPGRILAYAELDPHSGAMRLNIAAERAPQATGDEADSAHVIAHVIRHTVFSVCAVRPHAVTLHGPGFLVKSTSGKLARAASVARLRGD